MFSRSHRAPKEESAMAFHVRSASALGLLTAAAALVACPPGQPRPAKEGPPREAEPSATGRVTTGIELAKRVELRRDLLARDEAFRRNLVIRLGFEDDTTSGMCVTPSPVAEGDIDVHRSLFVHDRATLDAADFTLGRTLQQLADQAVTGGASATTQESIFRELWDTQNPSTAPGAGPGAHCDDAGGTVNGYPVSCRPAEGAQAGSPAAEIANYKPIALVNRLDLAHEGWRNCGEHRIIYAHSPGRAFIIFEAVLPNPKPGCRSACKPVAEFWRSLSTIADPTVRAAALAQFYYDGIPGFGPVVHVNNYTATGVSSGYGSSGSGQIRTNQFLQSPWLLKEFRLVLDCGATPCKLAVVPTMVKVNPFGHLWDQEVAAGTEPGLAAFSTRAANFQAELLGNVGSLAVADATKFGYPVSPEFDAAESAVVGAPPDHYLKAFEPAGTVVPGLFRDQLQSSPNLGGLSPTQIVNRALALSCAGCHNPASFELTNANSIGTVSLPGGGTSTSFPSSLGFVHASEFPDPSGVHPLSPALLDVFLPGRRAFFANALNQDACPCKLRFVNLPPALRQRALQVQEGVLRKFAPQLKEQAQRLERVMREARPGGPPPPEVRRLKEEIAQLERSRDSELAAALRAARIPIEPLAADRRPQAVVLDAERLARGDVALERQLRQKAVLDAVRSEPPRRTVTGHFRVH